MAVEEFFYPALTGEGRWMVWSFVIKWVRVLYHRSTQDECQPRDDIKQQLVGVVNLDLVVAIVIGGIGGVTVVGNSMIIIIVDVELHSGSLVREPRTTPMRARCRMLLVSK
jgi:hypothetical protein